MSGHAAEDGDAFRRADLSSMDEPIPSPRRARLGRAADLLTLLLALCLLLSPDLGRELVRALVIALLAAWATLRSRGLDLRRALGTAGLALAGGFALVLEGERADVTALGACALVGGLGACWRGGAAARALPSACALVALGRTALLASPWLFAPLRDAWLAWSRAVGELTGNELHVGPSMQGSALFFPCAALLVARFALVERRWRPLLVGLGCLALASVAQLLLIASVAARLPGPLVALLPWLGVAPVALLATSLLASAPARTPAAGGGSPMGLVVAAGACAALALALSAHLVAPKDAPRVLFYSVNEGPILNYEVPRYGNYGAYSLGLFGLLCRHLEADGFQVEHLRERLRPEHLEGVDALVTINVNTEWTEAELLTIWSWVDSGGNLLVLGDHTDVQGSQSSQNDLLAPVGIEFLFDSAVPQSARGWQGSDLYQHQLHAGLVAPHQVGTGVGASLRLTRAGALPLVVGRQGLADDGDRGAPERNLLGDYRYQPREQLGDVVLAAWSRLGAGKVLVHGDTSGFQNAPIEHTYDPYLRALFGWISGRTMIDLGLAGSIALSALFALCAIAALVLLRGGAAAALLPLFFAATLVGQRALAAGLLARPPLELPIALIDESHLPRVERGSDAPRSLDGFKNCLTRSGYMPAAMARFSADELARAALLVTVAPVRAYDEAELEHLRRFMARGGAVIACASHPESAGLAGLLALAGLEVLPRPVGPIPLHRDQPHARVRVEYVDAWQVGVRAGADVEAWVYGDHEGLPLALLARRGAGGLFLVGDSRFFGAANLESSDDFREPNILFLRALLDDLEELREEPAR